MSHRQYLMYMDHRRRTWNEPDRIERYLMALRAELRLANAERGTTVSLEEMRLPTPKWETVEPPELLTDSDDTPDETPEVELTAEEKTARIVAGLTAMFGKPRVAGEEKSPRVRAALGLEP